MKNKYLTKIIVAAGVVILIALILFAFIVSRKPGGVIDKPDGGETFPTTVDSSGGVKPRDPDENDSSIGTYKPVKIGNLIKLTNIAVSGATLYGTTTVLYMEKSTGHIYKIGLDGNGLTRISNTTIPKTFETLWSPKGDKLVVRYFDEPEKGETKLGINHFLADISNLQKNNVSTTTGEMAAVALPEKTEEIAVSPAEDKVFYFNFENGIINGIVSDFKNKNQRKIFELPFGEFNIFWPLKDTIALLTKPSFTAGGYLYFLSERTGGLKRILAGIKGLTANISPSGDKIIYGQSVRGGWKTGIYDLKKETSSDFGLTTFPEKCIWGKKDKNFIYCAVPSRMPPGDYPDYWYQGLISFSDSIWSKNITTGETQLLLEKTGSDIINPAIGENDDYLIFTDKAGGILWSLKLK